MGRSWIVLVSLLACVACRGASQSAQQKQKEAAEATQRAEEKAREATLTSGTMEKDAAAGEALEAQDEALRQRSEALVALRREQLDYRGRLQEAIDEIDLQLARAREGRVDAGKLDAPPDPSIRALLERREVLARDVGALERSTEHDWPALRARLDRDLAKDRQGR